MNENDVENRPLLYILSDTFEPIPLVKGDESTIRWGKFMESAQRRAARTVLRESPELFVSTAFMGCDHSFGVSGPPKLWETMVFDDEGAMDGYTRRYTTHEQAMSGHTMVVGKVLADNPLLKH